MIAKDGIPIIVMTGIILIVLLATGYFFESIIIYSISLIVLIIFIFHFFFFRDPDRETPSGENLIISPADGTVIKIDEVDELDYFKEKVQRVSIFMSVFNVHVNRIPLNGEVDYLEYSKGKFLAAFADDAAMQNEQSIIGIKGSKGRLLFKQIAGLIARRIVYHVNKGESVKCGNRFGLIRYGSRVDIFLPLSAKIRVKLKEKVKSGTTIVGEFT